MSIDLKRTLRAADNARFILTELCAVRAGECLTLIADAPSLTNAFILRDVAREMGAHPIVVDIEAFRDENGFLAVPRVEALRQTILRADAAFLLADQKRTNFGRILGNRDETDKSLLKGSRRYTLEANGMPDWALDRERVHADRARTEALYRMLRAAKTLRVTTRRGTDFTCQVGDAPDGMYPVMNILPFYGEVAIVPALGTVNGTVVSDGASEFAYAHRGFPIRPCVPGQNELWCEPLRMTYEDSVLVRWEGDPRQTERLDRLMKDVSPAPDLCDEVGLVTCTSPENDRWGWQTDGTHQTKCVHVAIGNNRRRGEIIHSTEHVDFDVHDPTIAVDGVPVYQDGAFDDDRILAY